MRIFILFVLFTGIGLSMNAQAYLIRDQSINVTDGGQALDYPWAGGLNNPQFSTMDMDGDGSDDLFIFDKSGNVILPFIQQGDISEIDFEFEPFYIEKFPKLIDWALLRDYNCDGFMDIYSHSIFGPGAMVYKNEGQSGAEWFSIADSLLYTYYEIGSSSGDVNIFISSIDLPAIHDIDDDGDLDIFTYQLQGSKVEFHKNLSQENDGICGLEYELKNRCWGYFAEDDDSPEILLGENCVNVVDPQIAGPAHHTGSTLLMLDINDDGYDDMVMGDVSYSSLTTVVNGGPNSVGIDSVTSVDYFFPNNDEALILTTFPASFYEDVNNDGIKDFIAAPNAQFTSDNVDAVLLYLNEGSDDAPELVFQQNDFIQGQMIDVGEGAYPVFVDIDQDGLMDLIIGNRKKITDSVSTSGITYFENTGTLTNPSFSLASENLFNLQSTGVGEALYPTFMDLNGDNALDLIVGNLNGELFYLLNSAGANEEMSFPGPAFPLLDSDNSAIDVGQLAKPVVFDLNEDDLLDLIVGERSGRLRYFENTGSQISPVFTFVSDTLGGVRSPGFLLNTGYSAPFFYKEDNEIMLILGSETGEIQYYDEISGNLDGNFNLTNGPASSIYEGKRTTVARYDLNNDELPDLIIGNYRGGVAFFRGDISSSVKEKEKLNKLKVYPNPANTILSVSIEIDGNKNLSLINQLGKKVLEEIGISDQLIHVNIENVPAGSYILMIENGKEQWLRQVIIIH